MENQGMTLKMWLDIITTTFIVVAGILALIQLRLMHRQRARESALQMLHSFQTPDFLTAVNALFELPEGMSKNEIEDRLGPRMTSLLVLFGTFESLGILVFRREVDIQLVEDFFSGILILSNRKLRNYVEEMRRSGNRQTYYEWYQWLCERVEKREESKPAVPAYIEYQGWVA